MYLFCRCIVILGLLAVASAFAYRRRRMQQFGVTNTNYAGAQSYNYPPVAYPSSPYNGQQGSYPGGPQYPPQTYGNGYNPQAGFAPVRHKRFTTPLSYIAVLLILRVSAAGTSSWLLPASAGPAACNRKGSERVKSDIIVLGIASCIDNTVYTLATLYDPLPTT